jgi:hypothetical protein
MCGSFPGLLIGRTTVHSGKDPAFVAYDQFLSTGGMSRAASSGYCRDPPNGTLWKVFPIFGRDFIPAA